MEKPTYRFASVELDTARRQLHANGDAFDLPPLVFSALETLAVHGDRVVTKDELIAALWPGRVVTDSSITQVIRKARVALEECGADPGIIKTQHGHGYRLNVQVTIADESRSSTLRRRRPMRVGAFVALIGGLLIVAAYLSDLLPKVSSSDPVEMPEETHSVNESTDAKIDEVVRLLREQAARSGRGLDPNSEHTIRAAVTAIVNSVDARKRQALDHVSEGQVEAAADEIVAIAGDLDTASKQSTDAAAASWSEAGALYYTSDIEKAIEAYESARELRPDDLQIASDLAFALLRGGRLEEALELFENIAASNDAVGARGDALRGAGMVLKLNGKFEDALEYFDLAMQDADARNDRQQRSQVLLQMGAVARARGENVRARDDFETAVDYAEEIGDQHLLAQALNNLGIVLAVTEQFESAEQALSRAYDIYVARHDLQGQADTLGNLGATALLAEDLDAAEGYLLRSVDIGNELGWRRSVTLDLMNLASLATRRQQFDVAWQRLRRAQELATAAGLREVYPIILANMGETARDQGNVIEACSRWNEALPQLEKMQHAATETVEEYMREAGCAR